MERQRLRADNAVEPMNGRSVRDSGFTLTEMMIVVLIIGLLAAIAIPGWKRIRSTTLTTTFISDLRVATMAFEQYPFSHAGRYPPETAPGVMPAGMGDYLARMGWTNSTSIGGRWDWDASTPGVAVIGPTVDEDWLKTIDEKIDDGDLATGGFHRNADGSGYVCDVGK